MKTDERMDSIDLSDDIELTADDDRDIDSIDRYDYPAVDWGSLISRVRAGDTEGLEQLYRVFSRGIRFHLCRQLGSRELDDRVHDTFLIIVNAIQKGDLREPDRLVGFVRTIIRRQVAFYINACVIQRKEEVDLETGVRISDLRHTPEQYAVTGQQRELINRVLERMGDRDREILKRFYLYEQTREQICREMDLTDTQFRLAKSRAKQRLGRMRSEQMNAAAA